METGNLIVNSENILPIIKKWLYSDTDIFLRELVSNGCDAIAKLKELNTMGLCDVALDEKYKVEVILDKEEKTIKIIDNGLGMTADEIKQYINQIAFSGATEFMEKYKDKANGSEIIGHFGLGFYSAFMVAEEVEINSLSYNEGAKAAKWTSDGNGTYELGDSSKTTRGTEITLFVMDEHQEEFLNELTLKNILEKYCAFMPVEIYFADELINSVTPLWAKDPKDCTDDEYKEFYKTMFKDFNDPHFWIHLNMDYPFSLKGILYFPKLRHEFEQIEGQVKLFCNQVFVADNVKEVVPEFLLLLKGVIDCPDIPLNVSRSFLQNDVNVSKMAGYISKKVADKLNSIFKKDRETYIKYWDDISPFIKYGCIKEKSFYEKMEKVLIFKTTNDDYKTLEEYLEYNKEKHQNSVFYVTDQVQQAQYIKMFTEQNMEAVIMPTNLDHAFISYLEMYNKEITFSRIDSGISSTLKTDRTIDEKTTEIVSKLFGDTLKKEGLTIKLESLKSESVPAVVLLSEEGRRMEELKKMFGKMDMPSMPIEEELVLNENNKLIQALIKNATAPDKNEHVAMVCEHVYDIAMMSHKPLGGEQMNEFIARNNKILELVLGPVD